ncbi:4-(cytidine 5'-diphospho)-2-C-methyl-D-erythritol kinase [Parabacteroides sp. AM08-6]|uniref:4-(cytidine 5'-diphospho)-2-C-methyl-D-erythritol kinase n=1 Tax=Parabacteroides sp. AM08-6 TaxID=2292053 RepID=UPI000EFEEB60|nr:4-(cytidine 5'-diphospho)-2-C-methyl-D-erythritol kinase [Parabacteroides sp. AM08-6]RHJ87867.1 4-(cytidine 5'-diphospho)-2-C-methyl-D-erythritol kinase [Parabacteroides sp. AM08-6]
MICFPNAKINLGLNVVSKRPDGYHNIETIFYPVPVKDALEIVDAPAFSFSQTGIQIDGPTEKNLVIKALNLLKKEFEIPALEVNLLKAIPSGAGLGGGSSDAAFMLRLLNDYCKLGIAQDKLETLAASIGADCPFFIRNTPVFASGTGNIFEPVQLSLRGYYLCLIKPDVAVSTPEAYSMVKPAFPSISLKEIIQTPVCEWKKAMVNDFEQSIFTKHPVIAEIKEALYQNGAVYASMSGSGSSVFGLFKKSTNLKKLFEDCFVWEGELP